MAIDTAARRRSAAGVPFLPLGPGVTPSVDKGVAWRQQAAWSYSGIAALTPDPAFVFTAPTLDLVFDAVTLDLVLNAPILDLVFDAPES